MKHTTTEPRPLLAAIDEAEAVARTRTRLASERVQAMEGALDAIGFGVDDLTGSLARLLALVADGWAPVRWTWDRLIADPKLAWGRKRKRSTDTRKNRIDSLRRSLNELARFGLVEWTTEAGEKRRACRAEAVPVITLCRAVILAEAAGKPVTSQHVAGEISQFSARALATSSATSGATTDATTRATTERHAAPHLLTPSSPKEPSHPFRNPKPENENQRGGKNKSQEGGGVRRLTADEVAPTAARLFEALGYEGREGRTLWRTAAAVVAGALSEAEIASAVRGTLARPRNDRVAAFYRILDTQCQLCGVSLSERLGAAFVVGGIPTSRPAKGRRDTRTLVQPRAAPRPVDSQAATDAARANVLRQLAAVAAGEF